MCKTGGSDGLVGEILKCGGSGMIFEVVWHEELVPPKWREGLIVGSWGHNLDGKVFCKIGI